MQSLRIAAISIAASFVFISSATAQTEIENLENSPLKRLVGTWDKEITIHPAIWFPEGQKKTGRHSARWILDGHHLQEEGVDSDGLKYTCLYSYDRESERFGCVMYQNNPSVPAEFVGSWDEEEETLTFTATVADNITMTTIYRFLNDDNFELKVVGKDRSDQVFFDLSATGKRVVDR